MLEPDKVALLGNEGGIYLTDISENVPSFKKVADIGMGRINSAMVPLPDGRVAFMGGERSSPLTGKSLAGAITQVQIWNPNDNSVQTLNEGNAVARLYHSSGILLPDATVWTGGGGAPGPIANANVEIYAPDYLFDQGNGGNLAARPHINRAPKNIGVGQSFTVKVSNAATLSKVTFMRGGAFTHARNSDARFLDLAFTVLDATTITVSTPNNPDTMIRGLWMLFAVDGDGTPSIASLVGVNMDALVDSPAITQEDSSLQFYNIQHKRITGAFELTVETQFDDLSKKRQKVFDFADSGPANSRIIMGQSDSTSTMEFVIVQGGTPYRIAASNAIVQGQIATWTVSVSESGAMELKRNGIVLASGAGIVPLNVERRLSYIGESNAILDDRFVGTIRDLVITVTDSGSYTFGSSTYERCSPGLSWSRAKAEAESRGGKLLEVNSQAENDFVVSTFGGANSIWLGISDSAQEGVWLSESTGNKANFFNWMPGQPDNRAGGNPDYARIASPDGKWDDGGDTVTAFLSGGTWDWSPPVLCVVEFAGPDRETVTFGKSIYESCTPGLSWSRAKAEAEGRGGKLLEIDSQAENDFVVSTFGGSNSIWLGISDSAQEGVWLSESTGNKANFFNWMPGQPDNRAGGNPDYARIASPDGKWDDGGDTVTAFNADGTWDWSPPVLCVVEYGSERETITFGNSIYESGTPGLTWTQAKAEAESRGGKVLEVNSQAENDFVMNTFGGSNSIWLGISDSAQEGVWLSVSTGSEATFFNWMPGQPDNGGRGADYARIASPDGKWDDGGNKVNAFRSGVVWDWSPPILNVIEFANQSSGF